MVTDSCLCFFFFNDTATTEIYTLSLHDALPIYKLDKIGPAAVAELLVSEAGATPEQAAACLELAGISGSDAGVVEDVRDRKSTRLNSSHANISYAVFCLKKTYRQYTGTHISNED